MKFAPCKKKNIWVIVNKIVSVNIVFVDFDLIHFETQYNEQLQDWPVACGKRGSAVASNTWSAV